MFNNHPNSYAQLLEDVNASTCVSENGHELLDELDLQARWFSGLFGSHFKTTDGRSISVKQFGFWNRSAGPDFLHCGVEIEGEIHEGAVELDLSVRHWYLHQHDSNPHFDKVVLHVVFSNNQKESFTRTSNHRNVPIVIIPENLLLEGLQKRPDFNALAMPGMCAQPFAKLSQQQVEQMLHEILLYRVGEKAKRTKSLISIHGLRQTRWIQVAETLGYKMNSYVFKALALRIPVNEVMGMSRDEILAILFGASDFLHPDLHLNATEDSQRWIESLWNKWWRLRQEFEFAAERKMIWKMSGVRPTNHPQRRLAALATIAANWDSIAFENDVSGMRKTLIELKDPFWNHHYTLTSKRANKAMQLIGNSRIDDFIVNQILPIKISNGCDESLLQLKQTRASSPSDKVRRAADRLFGLSVYKKDFLKKAWHHQALIQVYDDLCLEHIAGCEKCPFPNQLREWAKK